MAQRGNLERPSALLIGQRPVGGDRLRVPGKGFEPHLASDAMGGAEFSDEDALLQHDQAAASAAAFSAFSAAAAAARARSCAFFFRWLFCGLFCASRFNNA